MFAVIRAGGKQFKVAEGDVIQVERLNGSDGAVEFTPLLVVDDKGKTRTGSSALSGARVTATVVGDAKGPKVRIFKYRNKTRYRRRQGHRQAYTKVQIDSIDLKGSSGSAKSKSEEG